jgi:hypothetical protein
LPPLPLHDSIAQDDAAFTGLEADIGTEPLGTVMFDEKGLLFHRPNRLNPFLPEDSPLKELFFWRRTTRLLNTVFTFGILNDGRARELVEASRGAVFNHTQNGDRRFDDLVAVQRLRDIAKFMEDQIDPPELKALLDPTDPMYSTLVQDPFYTVPVTTPDQKEGENVFRTRCMGCHNTPNVFGNIDHIDGTVLSFPPHVGHPMDIGVAQRNKQGLEFRHYNPQTGQREPLTIQLIREDGTVINHTVVDARSWTTSAPPGRRPATRICTASRSRSSGASASSARTSTTTRPRRSRRSSTTSAATTTTTRRTARSIPST